MAKLINGKLVYTDQDKHNIELSKAMGKTPKVVWDDKYEELVVLHPNSNRNGSPLSSC